ncbi:MAG: hypothetical protein GY910_12835 [bacterium]|nr:hypothetical protein [Deltaproteobacteria bacterium]MCP4905855.1 hypothetical protein [bacterium]
MEDRARERLVRGEAWDDFCDTLKVAGRVIDGFGDEPSDQERAEWYRYLSRMVRNGFERMVENCEPDRPRLRDAPWRQSINVQSPDQDHLMCEFVNGEHEYKIAGNRGTVPYFIMATWSAPQPEDLGSRDWAAQGVAGLKEFDPTNLTTTSFLSSRDIEFDGEGNFEIILSQEPPERNGLSLDPSTTGILIRTVFNDRSLVEPPTMEISRLDEVKPRPIQPAEMSEGLAKAGQIVLGYAELVRAWWLDNLSKRPNTVDFSEATYLSNGGVLDRLHGFGCWRKPATDALVIRFTPSRCEHWILQVCNRWQENLDVYEDGQGFITKFTARFEEDGSVLALLADRDPGVGGNWIDTFQHEAGVFSLRLIQTEGAPDVEIHPVSLAQLESAGLAALEGIDPIESGGVSAS